MLRPILSDVPSCHLSRLSRVVTDYSCSGTACWQHPAPRSYHLLSVIYLPTLLQNEERQSLADKLSTSSARLFLGVYPS